MNRESLFEYFKEAELTQHWDFFQKYLRPAININKKLNSEVLLGTSKLGGEPDLPVDMPWPTHKLGSYCFIGQLNFAELPDSDGLLPSSGLLSLFYAYDIEERTFWQDPDYVKGFYIPEGIELKRHKIPEIFQSFSVQQTIPIEFEQGISIPHDKYQIKDWPLQDEYFYYEIHGEDVHPSGAHLLGYPTHCTLCFDPTPEGDFIPLITLPSFPELNWCWHDGDHLMVFIEKSKLQAGDFSCLVSEAG